MSARRASSAGLALRIGRSCLRRAPVRDRYGPHPRQVVELHRPTGPGPHPVAVVIHGGHWQGPYTKLVTRPLCVDLASRGIAALNVEYRRLGRDGGGWPQTFEDVAAAIDRLAEPALGATRLDLDRVTLVGHSAGGQLALWAAGRAGLPHGAPGAAPRVRADRVLGLAAVCDLERAGRPARLLLGGEPHEVPARWAQADPMRRLPLELPVALVHPRDDATIAVQRSRDYVAAAAAAGGRDVVLLEPPGGHRDAIDPASPAWLAAARWLTEV